MTLVGISVFARSFGRGGSAVRTLGQWLVGTFTALALVLGFAPAAHAQTSTVTAAWDANSDGMTTGYIVYYGTSSGSYQWSHDAGNQTSDQLSLNRGATYYFTVRAYNASAQLGAASNEATITLPGDSAPTASITATLSGSNAIVTWSTSSATSVVINGAAVATSGSATVAISATTTFTLVATGASGLTTTKSATVSISAPPAPTATISASRSGSNAVVTWSTANATSVKINGATVAASGSATVAISATTTFTLVATNAAGASVTKSATVTINAPPAPTATLTATRSGNNAVVTWSTTNATSVKINGATVAASGSATVAISATTTFTLVATNAAGASVTKSATVTVTAPAAAPTATVTAVMQSSNRALVSWQTTNAVRVTLDGEPMSSVNGSVTDTVNSTTTFTIVATNSAGVSVTKTATVSPASTPAPTAPGAPSGMMASVSGARVTFSWRAPSGAAPTRYLIDVGYNGSTQTLVSGYPVGNVLSIAADLPRGRYWTRIRAENAIGVSGYSNLATFTVGRSLTTPQGFKVRWVGSTAVLSWSPGAADGGVEDVPTTFLLEAGTGAGLSDIGTVNLGNVTSFSVPIPPGTYFVRVRAANDYGDSEPTADLMLSVAGGGLRAPTGFQVSRAGGNAVLRWDAPAGPAATSYVIEVGTAPGVMNIGAFEVGNVTQFSAPAPPGPFYVRVRAKNASGISAPSNEAVLQ